MAFLSSIVFLTSGKPSPTVAPPITAAASPTIFPTSLTSSGISLSAIQYKRSD
jgi:hypothetical protein